ncbi:MAG: hypothetical protein P9X27_03360 [Candidatus Kaelpia aquatica]|nr:hypothetical protein [Candidatus Kaelpia aquatica]
MLFKLKKYFFEKTKLADLRYLIRFVKERKIAFLVILFASILGYLMLRIFIFSEISEARSYQKRLHHISREIKDFDALLAKHPNIDREIELLRKRKSILEASFSKEREFLTLANQVIMEMEEYGIRIEDFKYIYDIPASPVDGLVRYGLQLQCIADFLNFGMFLENLERKSFKSGIYDLDITKIDDWNIRIDMRIDFILNQER